eukprot:6227006-Prymnesium_polylepis.7
MEYRLDPISTPRSARITMRPSSPGPSNASRMKNSNVNVEQLGYTLCRTAIPLSVMHRKLSIAASVQIRAAHTERPERTRDWSRHPQLRWAMNPYPSRRPAVWHGGPLRPCWPA